MLVETILNDVCLDKRVKDGCFKIENPDHMDALRDYLTKRGVDEEYVREYCNKVVEGKFPERQAYNQNGILVTFPTPDYKARAIQKGTHFEQDPTKGQKKGNLFPQGQAPAPQGQQPEIPPSQADVQGGKGEDPDTALPVGGAAGGAASGVPAPSQQAPETVPQGQGQDQQQLTIEPQKISADDPTPEPPKVEPRATDPRTRAAEKEIVKQILDPVDDTTGRLEVPIYEQLVRVCMYADTNGFSGASRIIRDKLLR